jgi:hypothetical protein
MTTSLFWEEGFEVGQLQEPEVATLLQRGLVEWVDGTLLMVRDPRWLWPLKNHVLPCQDTGPQLPLPWREDEWLWEDLEEETFRLTRSAIHRRQKWVEQLFLQGGDAVAVFLNRPLELELAQRWFRAARWLPALVPSACEWGAAVWDGRLTPAVSPPLDVRAWFTATLDGRLIPTTGHPEVEPDEDQDDFFSDPPPFEDWAWEEDLGLFWQWSPLIVPDQEQQAATKAYDPRSRSEWCVPLRAIDEADGGVEDQGELQVVIPTRFRR